LIAERIPGAKLVLLDHASHLFLTDQSQAALKAILEFLSSHVDEDLGDNDLAKTQGNL